MHGPLELGGDLAQHVDRLGLQDGEAGDRRDAGLGGHAAVGASLMWAPEATWVADYNGAGKGAFVVYWSSTVYPNAAHTPGTGASRVLWGATTDFTQATYSYGGTFIDTGADVIDTTMIQDGGTTYRISKDNGTGRGIYMESTTAKQWWLPSTAWTQLQDRIGAGAGPLDRRGVGPRRSVRDHGARRGCGRLRRGTWSRPRRRARDRRPGAARTP